MWSYETAANTFESNGEKFTFLTEYSKPLNSQDGLVVYRKSQTRILPSELPVAIIFWFVSLQSQDNTYSVKNDQNIQKSFFFLPQNEKKSGRVWGKIALNIGGTPLNTNGHRMLSACEFIGLFSIFNAISFMK